MNFSIILVFLLFNIINQDTFVVYSQPPTDPPTMQKALVTMAYACTGMKYSRYERHLCKNGAYLKGGTHHNYGMLKLKCMCLNHMGGMLTLVNNYNSRPRMLNTLGVVFN